MEQAQPLMMRAVKGPCPFLRPRKLLTRIPKWGTPECNGTRQQTIHDVLLEKNGK